MFEIMNELKGRKGAVSKRENKDLRKECYDLYLAARHKGAVKTELNRLSHFMAVLQKADTAVNICKFYYWFGIDDIAKKYT